MEWLKDISDVLYKYRIWEDDYHKRVLTHNEVFLSSADLLNDPFDASLPLQYSREELTKENILAKLVQVGRNIWPGISEQQRIEIAEARYKAVDFQAENYWNDLYSDFRETINKTYGILSLTPINNNLLMWSHYANSHKGFCIGFDKYNLVDAIQGIIGQVTYSTQFPTVPLLSENVGEIASLLMTKSEHWEYENEYRIIKHSASRRAFYFEDSTIKEIIFGCRIDPKCREEIITIAKSKSSVIKLFDCIIDKNEFKLNLAEIK